MFGRKPSKWNPITLGRVFNAHSREIQAIYTALGEQIESSLMQVDGAGNPYVLFTLEKGTDLSKLPKEVTRNDGKKKLAVKHEFSSRPRFV